MHLNTSGPPIQFCQLLPFCSIWLNIKIRPDIDGYSYSPLSLFFWPHSSPSCFAELTTTVISPMVI